jgi:dihydrofolate reductase
MRKLIMQQWMTLDGFVADPKGELDFFTNLSADANKYSDKDQLELLKERIDLIILGRKTYELFLDFWPTEQSKDEVIADQLNETKKVVFSNTLKNAPWGKCPAVEVATGKATDNVRKLKSMPGKDIVLWGSISVSQSLMLEDLIDEYHIQLCPTLLGAGRPLFPGMGSRKNLKLKNSKKYDSGLQFLQYVRA